ncbi:type VII secretion target [Nocardia sp. NPDC052316]|uniref:type VII secretion target n=2 Tax=Nocardiaceae TaxID=85025 RepID=UPI0037C849A4
MNVAMGSKVAGTVRYIEPNRSGRCRSAWADGDDEEVHDTDVHDDLGGNSMSDLSVETDAVRAFAATNAGIAGDLAGAGNFDAVKNVSALVPVFGLIGVDYLAMFAAAQVLQAKDINDLSAKYSKLSESAFSAAAAYDATDWSSSAALNAIGNQIGGAV